MNERGPLRESGRSLLEFAWLSKRVAENHLYPAREPLRRARHLASSPSCRARLPPIERVTAPAQAHHQNQLGGVQRPRPHRVGDVARRAGCGPHSRAVPAASRNAVRPTRLGSNYWVLVVDDVAVAGGGVREILVVRRREVECGTELPACRRHRVMGVWRQVAPAGSAAGAGALPDTGSTGAGSPGSGPEAMGTAASAGSAAQSAAPRVLCQRCDRFIDSSRICGSPTPPEPPRKPAPLAAGMRRSTLDRNKEPRICELFADWPLFRPKHDRRSDTIRSQSRGTIAKCCIDCRAYQRLPTDRHRYGPARACRSAGRPQCAARRPRTAAPAPPPPGSAPIASGIARHPRPPRTAGTSRWWAATRLS